jgi:hypothetical protein
LLGSYKLPNTLNAAQYGLIAIRTELLRDDDLSMKCRRRRCLGCRNPKLNDDSVHQLAPIEWHNRR